MNKQELINELKRISLEKQYEALTHPESKNYYEGMVMAYSQVVHMVNTVLKLDEPKKPVVPKFVAEWFEDNKHDLDNAIFGYIVFWEERDTESVLYQWFAKSKNKPIETIFRMKDGYEVEKEPLWGIKNADGNYLTKCALWGKDGVNYSFEWNPSHQLTFTNKVTADAAALLVNGIVEEVVEGCADI